MPASPKLNPATATATNDAMSQIFYLNVSVSRQVSLRVNMQNILTYPEHPINLNLWDRQTQIKRDDMGRLRQMQRS
jgi:hypothetical protein